MRISVTSVDLYRRYLADEEYELETLLAQLRGETLETEPMKAGKALHRYLESVAYGESVEACKQDGYTFIFGLDISFPLSPIRELKAEKVVVVDGEEATLVGKVDDLGGNTISDHKLTSRFDAERYTDSAQWRLYLDLLGANRFVYNIFEADDSPDGKHWYVKDFHRLTFWRYPGMEAENARLVADYARFVRRHLAVPA